MTADILSPTGTKKHVETLKWGWITSNERERAEDRIKNIEMKSNLSKSR